MDEYLRKLAKRLMDSYEEMYQICYLQVEKIINNRIKDINLIERTLDQALDIYIEEGFYLFLKLLNYYKKINPINAYEYLDILKEERAEEYDEFVKKYQKTKKGYPQ